MHVGEPGGPVTISESNLFDCEHFESSMKSFLGAIHQKAQTTKYSHEVTEGEAECKKIPAEKDREFDSVRVRDISRRKLDYTSMWRSHSLF